MANLLGLTHIEHSCPKEKHVRVVCCILGVALVGIRWVFLHSGSVTFLRCAMLQHGRIPFVYGYMLHWLVLETVFTEVWAVVVTYPKVGLFPEVKLQ